MTNLQRWLLYLSLFLVPYLAVVLGVVQSQFLSDRMPCVIALPLVLLVLFGVYAVLTVLYRVFTVKDCPEAAEELQRQIKEARADLTSKGFVFKDD